jgi:hypothetical protein
LAIKNHNQAARLNKQLAQRNQVLEALQRSQKKKTSSTLPPLKGSVEPHPGKTTFEFGDTIVDTTMAGLKKGEKIVNEAGYKKIVEERSQYKRELKAEKQTSVDLVKANDVLNNKIAGLVKHSEGLESEKDDWVQEKQAMTKRIEGLLEKATKNRSAKAAAKLEQNEDVNKYIGDYMKEQGFRNTKFAGSDQEVETLVEKVWHGIKDYHKLEAEPLKLNLAEFKRIYSSAVLGALSTRRQYVQSRTQEAAHGKFGLILRLIRSTH